LSTVGVIHSWLGNCHVSVHAASLMFDWTHSDMSMV